MLVKILLNQFKIDNFAVNLLIFLNVTISKLPLMKSYVLNKLLITQKNK